MKHSTDEHDNTSISQHVFESDVTTNMIMTCPNDAPCAGDYHPPGQDPPCCNHKGIGCQTEWCPGLSFLSALHSMVGCSSLPPNFPLCPLGRCRPTCLCRETLLKRIEYLLLHDKIPDGNDFGVNEEL